MILRDRYDGGLSPFEGDRELLLRHLPADARVLRARVTLTPVSPGAGEPFVETVAFRGAAGDWGATKSASTAGGWVEVDFHARRTVVGLSGQLGGEVQADQGGGFVPVSSEGTFLSPGQTPLTVAGSSAVVPSFPAARLRLFGSAGQALDVSSVRVRSAPSGVRLGLRGQPALWFHAGELTTPRTTPDFGTALQAYLDDAGEAVDGFWRLPFVLHTDAIGRLAVELEIEYLRRTAVLPGGVREAALAFGHGGLPRSGGVLAAVLPGDAHVTGGSGRVAGAFEATRVAFGPVGAATPLGALEVAPGSAPAHPVVLPAAVEAVAVDLLLASVSRSARLQLDLRSDLDGKPSGESLLPAPVPFPLDREMAGSATWVSVPLAAPLQLRPGQEKVYWLVMQSLEGEAAWSVEAPAPALPGMQLTRDGGFSWRQAALAAGPVSGLFRLRTLPAAFHMPVEMQVGTGSAARRVSLARFEPEGRVDLSLSDLSEVAAAFNEVLAAAPARCPEVEHLDNGGFEDWVRVGDAPGPARRLPLEELEEGAAFDSGRLAVTPDGRLACVALASLESEAVLFLVDVERDDEVVARIEPHAEALTVEALAVHPGGHRVYAAFSRGSQGWIWTVDLENRQALGGPLPFASSPFGTATTSGVGVEGVTGLALSADGGTLWVAHGTGQLGGAVTALDTARLEQAAVQSAPSTLGAVLGTASLSLHEPVDLALSPDGSRLHVLATAPGEPPGLRVLLVDTGRFEEIVSREIDLGAAEGARALARRGGRLCVLEDGRLRILSAAEGRVLATIPVSAGQEALAFEPDGARAFLAGEEGLARVVLESRAASPLEVDALLSDVAVAPLGDRVLAVDPGNAALWYLPLGEALPAAWTVTAGRVSRYALPGSKPFALLGEPPDEDKPAPGPSVLPASLAQVVAVRGGCSYELSFEGLSTRADALAEILWRGEGARRLRTDEVAITPIEDPDSEPEGLALHRARFTAPDATMEAEVRFTVYEGAAGVANVSLRGTAAVVSEPESALQGGGLPPSWSVPEGVGGLVVLPGEPGVRLRNPGAREAAAVRAVEGVPGGSFALEVRGRVLAAARPARVELRWLGENGADLGVSSWEISPDAFDALAVAAAVPAGARRAELRLVVPPGGTLELRGVDLRFPRHTDVPVTFVAQAPGDLAVVGWEVEYDQVPPPRPAPPPGGLSRPVPPPLPAGQERPGHGCGPGGGVEKPQAVVQPVVSAAPVLAPARLRPRPAVSLSEPVTVIHGIGRARRRKLQAAGMDSLEAVAAASPAVLDKLLPGLSERGAMGVILAARQRLRRR